MCWIQIVYLPNEVMPLQLTNSAEYINAKIQGEREKSKNFA